MKKGLIYLAFGKTYEEFAARTVGYSRQFTDLPILVLTNVKAAERSKLWRTVENVSFQYFELNTFFNREIKTRVVEFTPFEYSLYLDCDMVIQNPGVEQIMDLLDESDIVLNKYMHWEKGRKVLGIYRRAMRQFDATLPIDIWSGALVGFKKNRRVAGFFQIWNRYWAEFGRGREMPCLACAVQNTPQLEVKEVPAGWFAVENGSDEAIIQNDWSAEFYKKFNLPRLAKSPPKDRGKKDWNWVEL